ncbi:MAG: Mu-like prophage major head subunit gpT family protein [Magnetococcales bacterium]|nr:Mu-like prophage major head subunit gpT family protein [Magnetococcales bacterium]
MAIMTTATNPKDLWPGIHAHFGLAYNEMPLEYKDLYEIMSSDKAYEEDVEQTGFGLAPAKPEASSVVFDADTQGVTQRYTHVVYALGFVVSKEAIEDNLYERVATRRTRALAFSMRQTKEVVAANVYNRAFSGSYLFADGQPLISLTHPTRSGSQSNRMTVDADLSEAALESLLIQIMDAKNSRGLRISLMARKLIVPPQLVFEAHRILKSALQSGGANNDTNALKDMGLIPEGVKVNHYLTDPDAWFLRTNAPNGMTMFQRSNLVFTQDNDFNTENQKAKAMERYSVGCTDWRNIFGSSGA